MAPRNVEISKASKGLQSREYRSYVDQLSLEFASSDSPARAVIHSSIARGIGVVTGGNGAGKSTLIGGLRHLEDVNQAAWPERLTSITASGMHAGQPWDFSVRREDSGELVASQVSGAELPQIFFIDPAEDSMIVRSFLAQEPNAADRIEGIDAAVLDESTLAHASRILRRDYEDISFYEVELSEAGPDAVFPWFLIKAYGTEYDLRSAGRGELSALYLLWKISRVPDSSIVVIDEPEAGLASYSQSKLRESLAYLSVTRGIQFILSTHSPDLYLGLPEDSITVLESLPIPASRGPMAPRAAAKHLGARAGGRLVVFTEDAVAAAFVTAIIGWFDRSWLEEVEVYHSRNGESALAKVNEEFIDGDHRKRKVRLLTVFDGDQRPGANEPASNLLYLPGHKAPEQSLREVALPILSSIENDDLRKLGVHDPDSLRMALGAASGSDHHDWFRTVAEEIGDYESACNFLVQVATKDASFANEAKVLFDAIVTNARA